MNKVKLVPQDDITLLGALIARRLNERDSEVPVGVVTISAVPVERYGHPKLDVRASVDIGRKTAFVVYDHLHPDGNTTDELNEHAQKFAHTIDRLWNERGEMMTMLASVRAATRREVRSAVRRGLPYELEFVRLDETVTAATDFPPVLVGLNILAATLLPETRILKATYPNDLKAGFADIEDRQMLRAQRKLDLEIDDANGFIDEIGLKLLDIHGHDLRTTLAALLASRYKSIGIDDGDPHGARLRLSWNEGRIEANATLADGVTYSSGSLHVRNALKPLPAAIAGQRVREIIVHDAIPSDLRINSLSKPDGLEILWTGDRYVRFNASTGATW